MGLISRLKNAIFPKKGTSEGTRPAKQVPLPTLNDTAKASTDIQKEEKGTSERSTFDHDKECREIVKTWRQTGISLQALTPKDVLYSGQESTERGAISLDHKAKSLNAGVWLSRHLMYASSYTDFSSTIESHQIQSKGVFETTPHRNIEVILFAKGAPHPSGQPRYIDSVASDLYIAQQWPRLLAILCETNPEFRNVSGHLRECDKFTSEIWLHEPDELNVTRYLDVSHEKHTDRVSRYGNGNLKSELLAKASLFPKKEVPAYTPPPTSKDNAPSLPNDGTSPKP